MTKVKYERKIFSQDIVSLNGIEENYFNLLKPLEKICSDLGGLLLTQEFNEDEEDYNASSTFFVAKRDGISAFVEMEIVDARNFDIEDCILQTTAYYAKSHEHKELLAALHAFYDGKSGYRGKPKPEIVEREIGFKPYFLLT